MSTVIGSNLLAAGLRTEFADTYAVVSKRQADGRIGAVMDTVGATTRRHDFAYLEAAPHMTLWPRGDSIPTDAMSSVKFNVKIYEWARRVPWSKWDRKDDQTQSLVDMARRAGASAALLPERFFFDLLADTTNTLPGTVDAPDGANFFATTAGGVNRFGVSSGNLLTGNGVATIHGILQDYYAAIEQFMLFQDGKSQPLLSPSDIDQGVFVIHPAADTEIFEYAFRQVRQARGVGTTGAYADAATITGVGNVSNIVQDAGRSVELWGTQRLATPDWYLILKNPPKKPTFILDREGVQEFSSLEGDNNGDHTRTTAEEYIQWERRAGAGLALPYAAIKINNT